MGLRGHSEKLRFSDVKRSLTFEPRPGGVSLLRGEGLIHENPTDFQYQKCFHIFV